MGVQMPLLFPVVFLWVKPSRSTAATKYPFLCEQTDVLDCLCLAKEASALSSVAAAHLLE